MRSESSDSVKIFWPPFSRAELILLLRDNVERLASVLPLQRATLFGSWAIGRATAFSDVDVLVVYQGAPRGDAYDIAWKALHPHIRGLEVHVYAQSEAEALSPTLERMTRDGVELFLPA